MKRVDSIFRRTDAVEWSSSKGNQNKWFEEGVWYKEDGLGYEALAEVLVSRLLAKTNTSDFVEYAYESLEKNGVLYHGCRAEDFLEPEDDKLISLERLFLAYRGESAARGIVPFRETEDKISYVVDAVEEITGLSRFGEYLKNILAIDAFFLNEDRHFHNLAVIRRKDGTFRPCPVFDNGAALFSDTRGDYPLDMELEDCYRKIEAKPFSRDFDEQLDACERLYGGASFRAAFTYKDVEEALLEFGGIYEEAVLRRVYDILRFQMRKYSYFW